MVLKEFNYIEPSINDDLQYSESKCLLLLQASLDMLKVNRF